MHVAPALEQIFTILVIRVTMAKAGRKHWTSGLTKSTAARKQKDLKGKHSKMAAHANHVQSANYKEFGIKALSALFLSTSTVLTDSLALQLLAQLLSVYIIRRLALHAAYPNQPTSTTWLEMATTLIMESYDVLLHRRNPLRENASVAEASVRAAMSSLRLHNIYKRQDPIMQNIRRYWEQIAPSRRSKPEAKRDAIRTVSFLLKTRGPDLVAWSAEHDWQLNRDGLAPFICDFTGRAGDGQSTETKWANVAQLSPFTSSLQAATLDEDTLVQALLQGTRKKVATAMQELSGFGGKGTGFVLEHLLEGLAFVDEATGVFPWTKTSAPAAIGPNTEKLFQAFCPDKLPSDVMAAVLPLVKQMLPSKLFVDGKDIGVRLLVKDHVLQQNCCKLYQVLQFVFSGCVGTHGRIKATSNADEDSDDDDV